MPDAILIHSENDQKGRNSGLFSRLGWLNNLLEIAD